MRYVCIDVANGYTENFVRFVKKIRERHPHLVIMAGNVVTGEMTEELILSGADIVKVGIGPGSVCTTRKVTGVGYPQLSAIIECADAAHGLEGHICADGGCASVGDIAKAFGGGADFVMLGGMLAGHEEGGGDVVEQGGRKFMRFYGMSSKAAMERYAGGVAKYRAAEGREVLVPFRGPVADTVQEILGRRAFGMHLRRCATVARILETDDVRPCCTAEQRGVRQGLGRPAVVRRISSTRDCREQRQRTDWDR